MFGLRPGGLTDDERRRLQDIRNLVDEELVGGSEDGALTLDEYRWLAFWSYVQHREGPVGHGCPDVAAQLDPQRARLLDAGVMERIGSANDGQ